MYQKTNFDLKLSDTNSEANGTHIWRTFEDRKDKLIVYVQWELFKQELIILELPAVYLAKRLSHDTNQFQPP